MTTSLTPVTDTVSTLLAPNPGPMTLDGTNSYVIRAPGSAAAGPAAAGPAGVRRPAVVIDPGPDDAEHLETLAAAGPIELILITHHHLDHTAGSATLHWLTGAPVRAPRAADCHGGAVLSDGEQITAGGMTIRAVATPGHSADSTCFVLAGPNNAGPNNAGPSKSGAVFTGDTVLGRGSTVIGAPDGSLGDYLDSLRTIGGLGPRQGLPAHGPVIDDLPGACEAYLAHRRQRLAQVRDALRDLGMTPQQADTGAVVEEVYPDVDPAIRFAAEHSVAAQLAYLAGAE